MTAEILINLAYVALLGSAFTRTVTWLRVLLTVGSGLFVVYGIVEGITSIIIWNLVIGAFHGGHVVRDQAARRRVSLDADEQQIRDEWFAGLDDLDFHTLWSLGRPVTVDDEQLIAAGDRPDDVAIVLDGTLVVEHDDALVATLGRGQLVGEMSFVSGDRARASVRAEGPATLHRWDQRDLTTLDRLCPAGARAFDRLLQRDLAAKAA